MDKNRKSQLTTIAVALVIILIGTAGAIYFYTQKQHELSTLQNKNYNLNEVISERDSVVNELVSAFDEIETNLQQIREKRNQLSIDTKGEGNRNRKQFIIDEINSMNEMIENSRNRIAELEKKLKNSGFHLNSFKKKIAQLSKTVEEQNSQIVLLTTELEKKDTLLADLSDKIGEMETEIAIQSDEIESQLKIIEDKEVELNKAYMAYGTYKELKEKGLLTKDGGFMWMGRHTAIQEDFEQDYFTEINIKDTKVIPLHAKKAVVVSEHPNSSYSLVEEDGMISYLKIDNPDEFWKISKYAVIEVK